MYIDFAAYSAIQVQHGCIILENTTDVSKYTSACNIIFHYSSDLGRPHCSKLSNRLIVGQYLQVKKITSLNLTNHNNNFVALELAPKTDSSFRRTRRHYKSIYWNFHWNLLEVTLSRIQNGAQYLWFSDLFLNLSQLLYVNCYDSVLPVVLFDFTAQVTHFT